MGITHVFQTLGLSIISALYRVENYDYEDFYNNFITRVEGKSFHTTAFSTKSGNSLFSVLHHYLILSQVFVFLFL